MIDTETQDNIFAEVFKIGVLPLQSGVGMKKFREELCSFGLFGPKFKCSLSPYEH